MKPTLKTSPKFTSTDTGEYRYFFNGQEADNEVFAEISNFGYEFRQYDSRLGRWWSIDPKWNEYPGVSPYVFCNGSPIMLMDPNGTTSYEVKGERKQIDDGRNNIIIHDVTRHQFNKLQRSFTRNRERYDRLAEKIKIHNGYTQNSNLWDVSIDKQTITLPSVICSYHKGKPYLSEQIGKGVSTFIKKLDEEGSGDAWDKKCAQIMMPVVQGIALLHPWIGTYNNLSTIIFDEDIYGNEVDQTDKLFSFIGLFTGQASKSATGTVKKVMKSTNYISTGYSSSRTTYTGIKNNHEEKKED